MSETLFVHKPQVRCHGIGIETPLYIFTKDSDIKRHADYVAAKAGDISAAMQVISDLALSFIYEHRKEFSKNHIFVAPHALEATGDNAIPQVLAEVCALVAHWQN